MGAIVSHHPGRRKAASPSVAACASQNPANPCSSSLTVPSAESSPYAETGPVFIHAGSCGGYPWPDRYPDEFRGRQQVFRCYDAAGNIIGGHFAEPAEDAEAVIQALFADRNVEYIHTRNIIFGCYMLEVRR